MVRPLTVADWLDMSDLPAHVDVLDLAYAVAFSGHDDVQDARMMAASVLRSQLSARERVGLRDRLRAVRGVRVR